ncbi:MAG: M28 family metallopeptidase, partial [Bacteroidales bacterium]|nr:M28 family metallopeptidase [Bacteroidales bacterium]
MKFKIFIQNTAILIITVFLFQCKTHETNFEEALNSINTTDLTNYVKVLASDEFQGRRPFTEGETKTVKYLKDIFEKFGLKPGNNGSYFQEVPLVQVSTTPDAKLIFKSGNNQLGLDYKSEFVASTRRLVDEINIDNSELIFAGFGIVAPEYNWNDYKGLDLKGKTVVVLSNDPGLYSEDSSFFKGKTMTYYGRWTYKYEEAARQGAEAVIIIHDDLGAGYPWNVVLNGALVPDLYLLADDNYASRCKMEGWLTQDAAKKLFEFAGLEFSITKSAAGLGFKALSMNTSISINLKNKLEYKTSTNVMAYLEGSEHPNEAIVYSAHWDHLGIGRSVDGDSIYNGAVDNGTSLAWMFEIAEAFTKLKERPKRSVLFFAPTAEESGLLGSAYYVAHPSFELSKIVANINNDMMLPFGRMKDVMVTGYGQSELEDYAAEAAIKQGRYILPDPNSHTGMYFRSDHFSFAKAGVPSLFVRGNCDHFEKGRDWMAKKELEWLRNNYHKPTDEYETNWD